MVKTTYVSYGVLPIYRNDNEIFVCCVREHDSTMWNFPHGDVQDGETARETALRELREKTGIEHAELDEAKTFQEHYSFVKDGLTQNKTNIYYMGFVKDMESAKKSDIVRWIHIDDPTAPFFLKTISKDLKAYLKNSG